MKWHRYRRFESVANPPSKRSRGKNGTTSWCGGRHLGPELDVSLTMAEVSGPERPASAKKADEVARRMSV